MHFRRDTFLKAGSPLEGMSLRMTAGHSSKAHIHHINLKRHFSHGYATCSGLAEDQTIVGLLLEILSWGLALHKLQFHSFHQLKCRQRSQFSYSPKISRQKTELEAEIQALLLHHSHE